MLNPKTASRATVVLCGGLLLLLSGPLPADEFDNMAEELIALRGEVEDLHNRLDDLKSRHKNEMASLARRKAELAGRKEQQELRLKELRQALEESREKVRTAGAASGALEPVVRDAVATLKAHIDAGLPFKVVERKAELDDIVDKMDNDVLPAQKAVNRLWAFYEDEFRLTRENGIYSQTVDVNGDEVLADVARVGMVMMFFRTGDERYGEVIPADGGWRYRIIHDGDDRERVEHLFDSLQKQIRTGFFELPNTLPGTEEK
jgi:hypothetical protein